MHPVAHLQEDDEHNSQRCTAKFEMLVGRTSFNEVALEHMFIQGLPQSILVKVYSWNLSLLDLDNWMTIVHNLDHLHQGFTELKQCICPVWPNITQMQTSATTPTLDTSVPMDIDQSRPRPKMCTCYNCGNKGHLSCVFPKPWKQRICLTKLAEWTSRALWLKQLWP